MRIVHFWWQVVEVVVYWVGGAVVRTMWLGTWVLLGMIDTVLLNVVATLVYAFMIF